jgi:hypothetical protein
MRCRVCGGINDNPISRKEHINDVPEPWRTLMCLSEQNFVVDLPRTIPYASGHAPRVTLPSAAVTEGQVPLAYMALKILQMHLQVELKS